MVRVCPGFLAVQTSVAQLGGLAGVDALVPHGVPVTWRTVETDLVAFGDGTDFADELFPGG